MFGYLKNQVMMKLDQRQIEPLRAVPNHAGAIQS